MCEQLTTHTQLLGVDRVAVETIVHGKRHTRHNHQRDKEAVAIRELGDKEYRGQWRLHHTRHHTSHTGQCERGNRDIPTKDRATYNRQCSTRKGTHEQRGCKCTTDTASCICRSHSHHLEEHHGDKVDNQEPVGIAKGVE